jgi:hypothetical protein
VGIAEGLKQDSAINLDHVQTVEQHRLVRRTGRLSASKMREVGRPWPSRQDAPTDGRRRLRLIVSYSLLPTSYFLQ